MAASPALPLALLLACTFLGPSESQLLGGAVGGVIGGVTEFAACLLDPCKCRSNWVSAGYCRAQLVAEATGDLNLGTGYGNLDASIDLNATLNASLTCAPRKIPRDCPLPKNCTCEVTKRKLDGKIEVNGDFAVRAQWELLEPIGTSYAFLSASLNWELGILPVIFSDKATKASCCKACHDINANVLFNAGVNLAANATLLNKLNVQLEAGVDVTVQLKAKLAACNYWHHVEIPNLVCNALAGSELYNHLGQKLGLPTPPAGGCGFCLIYPPGLKPKCNGRFCPAGSLANPDGTEGRAGNYSSVGKGCAHGVNDPHFVGAQGTHFEFNGVPGESFCLLTDRLFHVNMGMVGYYDTRTTGASLIKDGLAVRTWIREMGVVWVDQSSGERHSLVIRARGGKSATRDSGFMGSLSLDGVPLPLLKLGETAQLGTSSSLAFVGHEKQGGGFFDVDAFELSIGGLLKMEIKLRPAHPLLQTATDAMTHLNVRLVYVERSEKVHGVLGQTYREGRERRAVDYTTLAHLLHKPISADGEGVGFLDGDVRDYRSSGIDAPDCKFSAFGGRDVEF